MKRILLALALIASPALGADHSFGLGLEIRNTQGDGFRNPQYGAHLEWVVRDAGFDWLDLVVDGSVLRADKVFQLNRGVGSGGWRMRAHALAFFGNGRFRPSVGAIVAAYEHGDVSKDTQSPSLTFGVAYTGIEGLMVTAYYDDPVSTRGSELSGGYGVDLRASLDRWRVGANLQRLESGQNGLCCGVSFFAWWGWSWG